MAEKQSESPTRVKESVPQRGPKAENFEERRELRDGTKGVEQVPGTSTGAIPTVDPDQQLMNQWIALLI